MVTAKVKMFNRNKGDFKSKDKSQTFIGEMFEFCGKRIGFEFKTIQAAKKALSAKGGNSDITSIWKWKLEWLTDFSTTKKPSQPPKLPIKISGYKVERITKTGFYVGCFYVTWEEYDAVGELRPPKEIKKRRKKSA